MRYMVVDDEMSALKHMRSLLLKIDPEAEVVSVDTFQKALAHRHEFFDAVFLDIEMPGMNGLDLARMLQEEQPALNIIFVTAYDEHTMEAYNMFASGYVLKPATMTDIQAQIEHLRFKGLEKPEIRVHCFGQFDVFYGDRPIAFERTGSKEILAYLINLRGASASRDEICMAMWQDEEVVARRRGYFRTLMLALRETLEQYRIEDILISRRNSYAVNLSGIECDYYRYLKGDAGPDIQFRGEYMSQYGWAEKTRNMLEEYDVIM